MFLYLYLYKSINSASYNKEWVAVLVVGVIEGSSLPFEKGGVSGIIVTIVPHDNKGKEILKEKYKTGIEYSSDPQWNYEGIVFGDRENLSEMSCIMFKVKNITTIGISLDLGEISIPIDKIKECISNSSSGEYDNWFDLSKRSKQKGGVCGKLRLKFKLERKEIEQRERHPSSPKNYAGKADFLISNATTSLLSSLYKITNRKITGMEDHVEVIYIDDHVMEVIKGDDISSEDERGGSGDGGSRDGEVSIPPPPPPMIDFSR